MKKIWTKLILSVSGILALVGINAPSGQASVQFNRQIAEVRPTTPLYLKLCGDILSDFNKQNMNTMLAGHSSHRSHYSHSSHRSHYSSR